jgi:hypothetical protein
MASFREDGNEPLFLLSDCRSSLADYSMSRHSYEFLVSDISLCYCNTNRACKYKCSIELHCVPSDCLHELVRSHHTSTCHVHAKPKRAIYI